MRFEAACLLVNAEVDEGRVKDILMQVIGSPKVSAGCLGAGIWRGRKWLHLIKRDRIVGTAAGCSALWHARRGMSRFGVAFSSSCCKYGAM